MRLAVATALVVSAVNAASGMSCATFRAKLDGAIIAGGRRVAFPRFKVLPGAIVQPDEGGIVGLDTQITCSDDDKLQAVDVTAMIDSPNDRENLQRHVRFNALVGATLCVLAPKTAAQCYSDAEQAQIAAIQDYLAAKKRGEPDPSGSDIILLKKLDAVPIVKATSDGVTFTVGLTK